MRQTTDEILAARPWMDGYPRAEVAGVYYGDRPAGILRETYTGGKYSAQEAVDVYMAKRYAPAKVEQYLYGHGDGYKLQGGPIIGGDISIRYGGGSYPYRLTLYNHHAGLYGFCLAKWDADANWGVAVYTPGWHRRLIPVVHIRDGIYHERIDAIFRRVETCDEYGLFDRAMVQLARQMWDELGLEGLTRW